jgi:dsDNA-specific endonuclease/ATPase MutS2
MNDEGLEGPWEPIVIPIEGTLDLHTFRPAEVKDLLDDYLESACNGGFEEVLIIHGKGTGVLRQRVQSILGKHPLVLGFRQADASRGGWGATVTFLRHCPAGESQAESSPSE